MPSTGHYLLIIFLTYASVESSELISVPVSSLELTNSIRTNDNIAKDTPFQIADELSEDIGISLDPPSSNLVIEPSIAGPGQIVGLIAKNPDDLRRAGTIHFDIIALGLYSGKEQRVPFTLTVNSNEIEGSGNVEEGGAESPLHFEQKIYKLELENQLDESQIALLNLKNSLLRSDLSVKIVGSENITKNFFAKLQENTVYVHSNTCQSCSLSARFQFVVVVFDSNSQTQASTLLIFNNPKANGIKFSKQHYTTSIIEGAKTFSRLVKLSVTGDNAEDVVFSLDDSSGLFAIHPKAGILMLQHPEFVSAETLGSQVKLKASATNGQTVISTPITVDIIHKAELSTSNIFFLAKNQSFTLAATKRDIGPVSGESGPEEITFSIVEGDIDKFHINEKTGFLRYTDEFQKGDIVYDLKLMARKSSSELIADQTSVRITVKGLGSNPITFEQNSYIFVAGKESPVGAAIGSLAVRDADSDAQIHFRIEHQNTLHSNGSKSDISTNYFSLLPENGEPATSLIIAEALNLTANIVQLVISGQDIAHEMEPKSFANVTILLHNMQKVKPKWADVELEPLPTLINLQEATPLGSFVHSVAIVRHLEDDRDYEYSWDRINDTSVYSKFALDSKSGHILTRGNLHGLGAVNLSVIVKNLQTQTSEKVVLPIKILRSNDSQPIFDEMLYSVIIQENPLKGVPVIKTTAFCEDAITYSLEGEKARLFSINEDGLISTAGQIDFEQSPSFALFVTAQSSNGKTATVPVRIEVNNENDNGPSFDRLSYTASVMEDAPVGTQITKIKATDLDKDALEYIIASNSSSSSPATSSLSIDSEGVVTIAAALDGQSGTRHFVITASDGSHADSAILTLNVVPTFKCIPAFADETPKMLRLTENEPPGSVIAQFAAKSLDSKCSISFALKDGENYVSKTSDFEIDDLTGELRTHRTFDFNTATFVPLVIVLRSGQLVEEVGATVLVQKANDDALSFGAQIEEFEIAEDAEVGSVIGAVKIVDPEYHDEIEYVSDDEESAFGVNKQSGDIFVKKKLDAEKETRHVLRVSTSSSDDAPKITIIVHVSDVNDNGPVFARREIVTAAEKSSSPGIILATLHAEDPDQQYTEKGIVYRLRSCTLVMGGKEREIDEIFALDPKNGQLRLEGSLREFAGAAFFLQVEASDGFQSPGHRDLAIIKVFVYDSEHVVVLELDESPLEVHKAFVDRIAKSLKDTTSLQPLPLHLGMHKLEGAAIPDMTDLHFVLANASTYQVLPAETSIYHIDTKGWTLKGSSPVVRPLTAYAAKSISTSSVITSPLFILFVVFWIIMAIIIFVIFVMLCSYRRRYLREKQIVNDQKSLAKSLQTPPMMSPIPLKLQLETVYDRANSSLFPPSEYSVQELQLNVGNERPKEEAEQAVAEPAKTSEAEYGTITKKRGGAWTSSKVDYATVN